MAIVQPVNNKTNTIEVSSEVGDLLTVATTFAALVALPGFPFPLVRGATAGPFVGKFRLGDVIYARDTGRLWLYLADNLGAPVLVLITEGSIDGNATAQGPDIVLVVAATSGKYAPFSMSSAVYSTIPAALAAVPAGGATIILLDDSYTLAAPLALPVATHVAFTGLGYGGASQQKVVVNGAAATGVFSNAGIATVSMTNVRFVAGVGGTIWTAAAFVCNLYAKDCDLSGELDFATNGATAQNIVLDGTDLSTLTVSDNLPAQVVTLKNGASVTTMTATSAGGAGSVTVSSTASALLGVVGVAAVGPFAITSVAGSVGSMTNVLSYSLRDTLVTGTTITSVGNGSMFGVTAANLTTLTCGGDLSLRNSRLDNAGLTTTVAGLLTQEQGTLLGTTTTANYSGAGGRVNAITVTTQTVTRNMRFSGAAVLADLVDRYSVFDSTLVISSSGAVLTKSRHAGQVTVAAALTVTLEQSYIDVSGLAAGQGAIVNGGGTLNLREVYARGLQAVLGTNLAVSGTGTVNIAGALGGGCFLASTLTIATTLSKGLGNHHIDVALAANTTMLAVSSGGDVVDAFRVTPTASGFNFELYDPSTLPVGLEVAVKNVDYAGAFGFNVVPAAGNTLDNLATGITLGQNNVARLRVVSATAWETF